MHISRLVLHGFKSFGQRTALDFGEGITGVVGPNGCGKTNIVDALRWVLGEQKQSVLRSSRMEEVIFHGSRNHKPSGLSEVTLTIHNDRSALPLEYIDIEISRRLYRDGESEFLINRNPCRLKDILDLFMDTGMASDAYSVIELKMIEAILSDVEDDRRRMFEEAAGINKYKKQRGSAQRKLEVTRQDLERVNDIIGEVENQVKALHLQLKRFERHKRLTAELRGHELGLAQHRLRQLAHEIAPLQEALASGRDSHQAEAALIAKDEERLGEQRALLNEHELGLEDSRKVLAELSGQLSELKEKQLVWGEQLHSNRRSLERFERERESEANRTERYKTDIGQLEKELEVLLPTLDEMQGALDTCRAEEEAIVSEYQRGEQHLQSVRERKFNHRHLIQEEEARRRRTEELSQQTQMDLEHLEGTITEARQNLTSLQDRRKSLDGECSTLRIRVAELSEEQGENATQLQELDAQESKRRDEQQNRLTQLRVLQSRLEIMNELVASHEGYPSGTRDILTDTSRFRGLLGTAGELVSVKPRHALALETALGPFAMCLVTETLEQARELLHYAEQHSLGRLSVIPLDRVKPPADGEDSKTAFPGTPLLDLIEIAPELAGLYHRLLAGFYWIEEVGESWGELPPGVTAVTSDGHLWGAVPYLTHPGPGGSAGDHAVLSQMGGTIVGRSGEIERLEQAIGKAAKEQSDLDLKLTEVQEQRSQLQIHRQRIDKAKEDALEELAQKNGELAHLDYEYQHRQEELQSSESQIPSLKETLQGLQESLEAHDKVLEHLHEQESGIDEGIKEAEVLYQAVRTKRDHWQSEVQDLRVQLLTVENQRENLAARKLSMEDSLSAAAQRIGQLEEEQKQAQEQIEELTRQLSEAEGHRTGLEEKVAAQQEQVEVEGSAVKEMRDQLTQLEEQIRQRQHGREAALTQQQDLELRLSDYRKQEELIRSRIREVYHEDIPEPGEEAEEPDQEVLEAEVEKARASLERIGPINMAVAEEYAEESERLTFLKEQRDDLLQAEESLQETIHKIDLQARNQFRETYDQIRHHFKHTFRLFFEGGEGDLRLMGDPDPLESGIEIIAQPPGKRTSSLRSLSGGEKALTAIALLFAIYMVKPSPFCILDEVDAPLDDVNVEKFTKVIKQFSKDTQFIIVTHNKLTMQSTDYLYGVTMAEEGFSQLVSVDLSEYAVEKEVI